MLAALAAGALGAVSHEAATLASGSGLTITRSPDDPDDCMCGDEPIGHSTWVAPDWLASNHTSIFDTAAAMKGVMQPLSAYRSNVTMLVNVASA